LKDLLLSPGAGVFLHWINMRTSIKSCLFVMLGGCILALIAIGLSFFFAVAEEIQSEPQSCTCEHTGCVLSLAVSPDGTYLVTGNYDGTTHLRNARTGAELRRFAGHNARVTSVAFSPNGRAILTSSDDETVLLWDVTSGQGLHRFMNTIEHGPDTITAPHVAFSPQGISVAATGNDVRLWGRSTGTLVRTFSGHSNGVTSIAFSPDGTSLLTGSIDGTARLWNVQTGGVLHTFVGHTSYVWSVAVSPDGKYALTGSSDRTARLWNIQDGAFIRQFTDSRLAIWNVAFSPDGSTILTGNADGTVQLWNVQTGALLHTFSGHSCGVSSMAFTPDGLSILTSSWDGTLRLWDIRSGKEIWRIAP
jgi:WD40 repeat protein